MMPITVRELREAATPDSSKILVAEDVLAKFARLWETQKKSPLRNPLRTLLRFLGSVENLADENGKATVQHFAANDITFHLQREDDSFRVINVEFMKHPLRFHLDSRDLNINRLFFPKPVVDKFALDHRILCGSTPQNPYAAVRRIFAQTREYYGMVWQLSKRRFRLVRKDKKEHRVFCDDQWRFIVVNEGNRFVVESIVPICEIEADTTQ